MIENKVILTLLAILVPFFVAGIVVIVGLLRNWSFFTKPFPVWLDVSRHTVSIHKRFGAKGMRFFWFMIAFAWIVGLVTLVLFLWIEVCK